jgi:hypothetical protein
MLPKSSKNILKIFPKPLDKYLLSCYYIRVREKTTGERTMLELTNQNQRIIAGCLGNGVTFGDVLNDQTVAHVSFEGQITWHSDYKKKIAEATKKHIQETSLEYQKQAMIPLDAIISPRDHKFMATYLYKNSQGQYKHLADIYYPKGKDKGGVYLKVWEGIVPPEILEEMNQLYKSNGG